VYSKDLVVPLGAFAAGLGDHKFVTTLCPGGKERMRRLMGVIASGRVDLKPMVTHRFKLDQNEAAYDLFSHQRDGVLKRLLPREGLPREFSHDQAKATVSSGRFSFRSA
jgi:hypothetical protein